MGTCVCLLASCPGGIIDGQSAEMDGSMMASICHSSLTRIRWWSVADRGMDIRSNINCNESRYLTSNLISMAAYGSNDKPYVLCNEIETRDTLTAVFGQLKL